MTLTLLPRCNNLNETREFYRSVLGFYVADTAEDTVAPGARICFNTNPTDTAEAVQRWASHRISRGFRIIAGSQARVSSDATTFRQNATKTER